MKICFILVSFIISGAPKLLRPMQTYVLSTSKYIWNLRAAMVGTLRKDSNTDFNKEGGWY